MESGGGELVLCHCFAKDSCHNCPPTARTRQEQQRGKEEVEEEDLELGKVPHQEFPYCWHQEITSAR